MFFRRYVEKHTTLKAVYANVLHISINSPIYTDTDTDTDEPYTLEGGFRIPFFPLELNRFIYTYIVQNQNMSFSRRRQWKRIFLQHCVYERISYEI